MKDFVSQFNVKKAVAFTFDHKGLDCWKSRNSAVLKYFEDALFDIEEEAMFEEEVIAAEPPQKRRLTSSEND